jgi:hypothetical protein
MPRWYAAFRCVGKLEVILKQLSTKIRNDNLGKFVPRICFEKRPQKQFYLCIAIESPVTGELPPELKGLLGLPCLRSPVPPHGRKYGYQPFTREQIRGLVGGEVNVEDYVRRIRYRPLATLPHEDPFGTLPEASEQDDRGEQGAELTHLHNHLLYWLSTVGIGSVATFQTACHTLGLSRDGTEPRRILHRLRLLGHLECSRDGARWSIAPPVLTQRSHLLGDDTHVLCGGRDTNLLDTLKRVASVEEVPQWGAETPATVYVRGVDAVRIAASRLDSTIQLRVVNNAAERLADLVPPIAAWPDTLQVLSGIRPHMFDVRRFNGPGFVDDVFEGKSGLYELWPPKGDGQPSPAPRYTLFYEAKLDRWLRGDWYGLRFLALSLEGESCEVQYDQDSGRLAVPEKRRWPELYERALVLASGRLPAHRGGWLLYEAVSSRLLDILRTKLHLEL